ncbi:MAG: HAD family phosphatase [Anaerolineales bacterium]|nr:HAD family phosphatase [Anaerolineales bacterium]
MITTILWDIGGVILRTEDSGPREQLAAELGLTRHELEKLIFGGDLGTRAQKGEITPVELWAAARSALKLPPDAYPDFSERFFDGDRIDYDLVNFICSLKPRYKTGIISNAWKNLPEALEHWEIADAFDMVVGSGDEGIMKPDARIYQLALARAGAQANECIFVDDFPHNIEGAQAVGMQGILFRSAEQVISELKTLLERDA